MSLSHEEWRIGTDSLIAESRGHFDAAEYERQLNRGCTETLVQQPMTASGIASSGLM